jgi:hypothetical protein
VKTLLRRRPAEFHLKSLDQSAFVYTSMSLIRNGDIESADDDAIKSEIREFAESKRNEINGSIDAFRDEVKVFRHHAAAET